MIGPGALSRTLVNRINADAVAVLKEPATREMIVRVGAEPRFSTPEQFAKMQREEYVELGALIRETGMKVQ
jgi:tripartite-type tricarboxylate transporter receptor subunit TctC